MPGDPDELYVRARATLLAAADALAPHIDSLVLVGAQAVYLHTGAADLGIAEYTQTSAWNRRCSATRH